MSSHTNVLLMGDFNARTATVDDIAIPDTHIFDFIDVGDSHIIDDDSFSEIYKSNNINISRKSQDTTVNRLGSLVLIDHCRANNLVILNGRAFNDSNTGKFTCAESSVVDYVVCSSHLLMNISYFDVEDFL